MRGKAWIQPQEGLAFSFSYPSQNIPTLTSLEVGIHIAEFFKKLNLPLSLKWPNDLINSKGEKCGGIILNNHSDFFIVGVGINLSSSPQLVREHFPAGALIEGAKKPPLFDTFKWPTKELPSLIYQFLLDNREKDEAKIPQQWEKYCYHLNKKVKVIDDQQETVGLFLGVNELGQAKIKTQKQNDALLISTGSLFLVN